MSVQRCLALTHLIVLFSTLAAAAKDPYRVLGLTRQASDADIKRAYRAGALKYHPDKVPSVNLLILCFMA